MLRVTMFLAWFFQAGPIGTQEGCNYGQAAGNFQNSDFDLAAERISLGNNI